MVVRQGHLATGPRLGAGGRVLGRSPPRRARPPPFVFISPSLHHPDAPTKPSMVLVRRSRRNPLFIFRLQGLAAPKLVGGPARGSSSLVDYVSFFEIRARARPRKADTSVAIARARSTAQAAGLWGRVGTTLSEGALRSTDPWMDTARRDLIRRRGVPTYVYRHVLSYDIQVLFPWRFNFLASGLHGH